MDFPCISSRKNEMVKAAAALQADGKLRAGTGSFLAEGARLCCDAAQSGVAIERLFFTAEAQAKYDRYLQPLFAAAKECYLVEEHVAELLSSTKNSQGVYAVCRMGQNLHTVEELPEKGRFAALETLQDPGNLGTVLRTAEALGIDGVILCGACCDVYAPKTLRSAMGAVFRVQLYREEDVEKTFSVLQQKQYHSFAAVPDSAAVPLPSVTFPQKSVIFIGNEGNGLSELAKQSCKTAVTIPMRGRAESLNASASASILLWELAKSRE